MGGTDKGRTRRQVEFGDRVLQYEQTNPQTYVDECSNGIFSLLKKEYDTPRNRAQWTRYSAPVQATGRQPTEHANHFPSHAPWE